MKGRDRLVPIVKDMGFLEIKPVIVGCVIQYCDVPKSEESEEQDKTGYQLEQTGCSRTLALGFAAWLVQELLRQEVDSKEKGEIQENDSHDFRNLIPLLLRYP